MSVSVSRESPLTFDLAYDAFFAAVVLLVLLAFVWPRGRMTHRYKLFIAAPPQAVWNTYFMHINKTDYRPGTKIIDAEIVSETPLTVRATVQHDIAAQPRQIVMTYDLYEPYTRYLLRAEGSELVEEGEFVAEPSGSQGGTRLRVSVTGPRRGLLVPWMARRRVLRNHAALKAVCEGRPPPLPQRGPLPAEARWEALVVFLVVLSLFLPLPWQVQLPLSLVAVWVGWRYLRRFLLFARRL